MNYLKNGEYAFSHAQLLGSGSFGKVLKCVRVKDEAAFALKIVEKSKLKAHGGYLFKALEREILTQKMATKSGIPFFVEVIDDFEDEKNIYIVMEYCERSLMDFLAKRKPTEQQALELVFQVALGLNYLHSIHITHRDIKPENILIKDGILKIADFGFASNSSQLMTNLGTAPYMSPELFLNGEEAYTSKVDVWALNTCLYRLLTGKVFFWSPNRTKMEKLIKTQEFLIGPDLQNISAATKDLLAKGYTKDPTKRLSMQEYVYHDAFSFLRQKYASLLQKSFYPTKNPATQIDTLMNTDLIELFLRFRNNCMAYSKLSWLLLSKGLNKLTAFLLLKKHIQNISAVLICFNKRTVPHFKPFDAQSISTNDWERLCSSKEFYKVVCLILDDISTLTVKYAELFKEIQSCVQSDKRLAFLTDKNQLDDLFDLNICYKEETMKNYFDEFIFNSNSIKDQDTSQIVTLMRKIQLYEVHSPAEILR